MRFIMILAGLILSFIVQADAAMQICFADGQNSLALGMERQIAAPVTTLSVTGALIMPRKTVPVYGAAFQGPDYGWTFSLNGFPTWRFTQELEPLNNRWQRVPCD